VANWTRALGYVAGWAAQHENIVSMALVSESRQPWDDTCPCFQYNWMTLVGNMTLGSDAVHRANPDLLISWSGLQYDEDLSALTSGTNLLTSPCYMCISIQDSPRREPVIFDLADYEWGDKVSYELHLYTMTEDLDVSTCGIIKAQLYRAGFNALGMDPPSDCSLLEDHPLGPCRSPSRLTPVAMTEFGTAQDPTFLNSSYIDCLREFTTENDISWAVWSLAGSYRSRQGNQGVDDSWALMNYDWEWLVIRGVS
jgi:endoglucanase